MIGWKLVIDFEILEVGCRLVLVMELLAVLSLGSSILASILNIVQLLQVQC